MPAILPAVQPTGKSPSSSPAQALLGIIDQPQPAGQSRPETDSDNPTTSPFLSLLQTLLVTVAGVPAVRTDTPALPVAKTAATPQTNEAAPAAALSLPSQANGSAKQTAAGSTALADAPGTALSAGVQTSTPAGASRLAATPAAPRGISDPGGKTPPPAATVPNGTANPAASPASASRASGTGGLPAGATLVATLHTGPAEASVSAAGRQVRSAQSAQPVPASPASPAETQSSVKNSSPASAPTADLPDGKAEAGVGTSVPQPAARVAAPEAAQQSASPPVAASSAIPALVPEPAVRVSPPAADGKSGNSGGGAAKASGRSPAAVASVEKTAQPAAANGQNSPANPAGQAGTGPSPRQGTAATPSGSVSPAALAASAAAKPSVSGAPTASATRATPVAEQVAAAAASRAQLVQRGGSTQFYVRLDPPDLGTVHVHLQASEGNVSARLVVSSEQARSALEAQLPDLRSRLGSAGVQLGGLDVSHQQAGGHGAHSPSGEGVSAATPAAVSDPGPVYGPAGEGAVNVIA